MSAFASVNAQLSWVASSDPSVAGYNIYYGSTSRGYTNMVAVGNVTNAMIPGLAQNTTYFFAAKARNSTGTQSAFSNEAAFAGVNGTPNGTFRLKTLLNSTNTDPLVYSLDASAPPGATINSNTGAISWTPGLAYASTTNYISVIVTDTANPALNTSETFLVVVGDYLSCQLGATAVYAGQPASLPLIVTSSSTVTNIQIAVAWPGSSLLNPILAFSSTNITGSIQSQNNQLVIQLQTSADQPLTGTNQVAQVNFQAAPGQSSGILNIPVTAATGNTAAGSAYANVVASSGEVVVVGTQTILRPLADPVLGRTLSVYANPGTYQLLYTTSLTSPVNWTPLMTCQQTNAVQT
ncbi:MAG TPA: fibronectin type III domain-containing protein, partial [Verrucomicrobiae bacterium]|nr:fibronectin type III domain-containing protein [Verrucomicrobiae bacterium]